jgi:sulfite reductase alpha subunit-like flavoprotein
MKIIITEAQYDKLTEENLREFLYSFWGKQKRSGEEPVLDDMLYNVLGVRKNSSEDYQQIRPIWYEYNGGVDVLYDKMIGDIYGKTFEIQDDAQNLYAEVDVVGMDAYNMTDGTQVNIIELNVSGDGSIEMSVYDEEQDDDEDENYRMVTVSIYEALEISREYYETGDLLGHIRSVAYDYFYNLLEKYGLPIDVEVEIV